MLTRFVYAILSVLSVVPLIICDIHIILSIATAVIILLSTLITEYLMYHRHGFCNLITPLETVTHHPCSAR